MRKPKAATTAKGSLTRDGIVEAARKKLIQRGIDEFGMRDIADSLDLKLSNLQYYFKTREALILHILEAEATRDVAIIQAHHQKWNTADDAFRAIVRDLVIRWRGDGGVLFSTLGTLALHNKVFRKLHRAVYANYYQSLEDLLRRINPNLDDTEIVMRVRLITALIDGSAMQTQVGNTQAFIERVQAQAELIALT